MPLPVPQIILFSLVSGLSLTRTSLDMKLRDPKFREEKGGSPEPESQKWVPRHSGSQNRRLAIKMAKPAAQLSSQLARWALLRLLLWSSSSPVTHCKPSWARSSEGLSSLIFISVSLLDINLPCFSNYFQVYFDHFYFSRKLSRFQIHIMFSYNFKNCLHICGYSPIFISRGF